MRPFTFYDIILWLQRERLLAPCRAERNVRQLMWHKPLNVEGWDVRRQLLGPPWQDSCQINSVQTGRWLFALRVAAPSKAAGSLPQNHSSAGASSPLPFRSSGTSSAAPMLLSPTPSLTLAAADAFAAENVLAAAGGAAAAGSAIVIGCAAGRPRPRPGPRPSSSPTRSRPDVLPPLLPSIDADARARSAAMRLPPPGAEPRGASPEAPDACDESASSRWLASPSLSTAEAGVRVPTGGSTPA